MFDLNRSSGGNVVEMSHTHTHTHTQRNASGGKPNAEQRMPPMPDVELV
jgi:hypothetical protein